jgi:transposase
MAESVFVGLDAHKSVVVATTMNAEGRQLDQSRFGPTDAELVEYLERWPGSKRVVIEASPVWEHYFDAAASTGAEVILSHPTKTRLIAEASLKSDRVDSEALATLLRLNAVPEAFAPDGPTRALRRLVRDRFFYSRKSRATQCHVYSALIRRGIPFEPRVLSFKRRREKLRLLGIPEVDRGMDLLAAIENSTKEIDRALHAAFLESKEAQLLATIPGVGELTALTLVSYLCPIDRWNNVDEVVGYCGLCPTNFQSATVSRQGHLRKDSNGILRWILVEASWSARRYDPRGEVAQVGKRIGRKKGAQRGAISAAHKLLKICYGILRRGTPYEPHAPERLAVDVRWRTR